MLFKIIGISHGRRINIWKYENATQDVSPKNKKVESSKEDTTFIGLYGKKKIYIDNDIKHMFICGTTGSGKTVTISNFVESIFKNDYPSLIVDGKGDIGNGSILDYIHKFKKLYPSKKVYIIDLNNPNMCDKYNPFQSKTPTIIKDMLICITEWSEEHYKINASRYIQRLIYLMMKIKLNINFNSIIQHLASANFKALSLTLQKQNIITKQEHIENVKLADSLEKIIEGVYARFTLFIESDIGCIFDGNSIDIPTALNENAIIVFILNPLIYPSLSPYLGKLITIDAKQGVHSLFHKKFSRIFYIFDELSVYANDELLLLVNLSRSANITTILSTQSLSDLDAISEAFRKQVIESCNNYIIMRQNEPTNAENWANTIGTKNTMDVTYQIKNERNVTDTTGLGSAKITKEYLYHPDVIKNLKTGEGIYISKDTHKKYILKINKPNI